MRREKIEWSSELGFSQWGSNSAWSWIVVFVFVVFRCSRFVTSAALSMTEVKLKRNTNTCGDFISFIQIQISS